MKWSWRAATAIVACSFVSALSPGYAQDEPVTRFNTGSSDAIVDYINQQIRQGWTDNEVKPSDVAEDAEWLRRVYLDIVGHIPPAEEVARFLEDKDKAKRAKLIEKLLDEPGYERNMATIWTNLSVGRRATQRGNNMTYSREDMYRFYLRAFHENRPWDQVVYDVVSAEGRSDQNGAVNYLLAQLAMPDEGVQATAKTTRLFMGIQVQCTQCHNHPFNKWEQDQFWQFNSFFRQLGTDPFREYNPRTGRDEVKYISLVRTEFSGPVFFEPRSGEMKVAYPQFFDQEIPEGVEGAEFNRRERLAKLMTQGEQPWIAKAMVNRTWAQFMGYGFTKPVDDMGPHNAASHPDLLDRLTAEFVKSKYDVKQLIRWIANSEAYNLTSQFGRHNEVDNPSAGEVPLFSHMYVKTMSPEQLYDSLIIATEAHKAGRTTWTDAESKKQEWMQQFVIAFDTDEADEATSFNGTIPQALMMMNSELVQNAISTDKGTYLYNVLAGKGNDIAKINQLYESVLGRKPIRTELSKFNEIVKKYPNKLWAYQDMFWALLNSNEFIFNH
jgi:hypothetical protein